MQRLTDWSEPVVRANTCGGTIGAGWGPPALCRGPRRPTAFRERLAGALPLGVEEEARGDHRIRAEEDELVGRFAAIALLAVDVLRRVRDDDYVARLQDPLLD